MPLVIVNESVSHGVTGSVVPRKDSFSPYTCIRHFY